MKKYLLILLMIVGLNLQAEDKLSETAKQKIKESLLSNNSLGNYFVIAFPPNEVTETFPKQLLGIYIAAKEQTKVRVYSQSGFDREYIVESMGVRSITTDNDLIWDYENRDETIIVPNGFIIESEKPVSVYVLNSKRVTSEGYLAIPVKSWGTEYIHCSYWDFNEAQRYKSGFTVLAAEDRTKIEIILKGRGENYKTLNGYSIGDTLRKTLNKGDIFMIQGTGESRGEFDLSGSIIKGDKPIGVISSNERVMIPTFVTTNGRDHLSAMIPPVSTWGKEYFSVELDRGTDKGDYFRVVAAEDNTEFEVKWYDKKTGEYIGSWDGILEEKGDFEEYSKVSARMPHDNESIRGVSYFKANKPIFVMQYSYSADWDNSQKGNFDPFMFPVTSVEQFTKGTIFQTPSNSSGNNEYKDNFVNLIVLADAETEQERIDKLNTMMYDGQKLTNLHPELKGQKFPALGTDYDNKLYWVTLKPEIGQHIIFGDVSFGGYVYGFAQLDSYGWPAASGYNNLTLIDTIAPAIEVIQTTGTEFKLNAVESNNFSIPDACDDCLPQIDQGFTQIPTIIKNENFAPVVLDYENMPELTEGSEWYGSPVLNNLNLKYSVLNKREDATLHLILSDNTFKNYSEKVLNYYADKLSFDQALEFPIKEINKSHELVVTLKSNKDYETTVNEMKLLNISGNYFKIKSPAAPFTLEAQGEIEVKLEYTPTRPFEEAEKYEDGNYDLDSILIKTDLLDFTFAVKGWGVKHFSVNNNFTSFEIYPNPSSEIINFKSEYNFNRFEIINLRGKTALEGEIKSNTKSINISKLTTGTYYLRLISDTQSQISTFQKVK